MKKFLCLGLITISALTTFVGCGKKEEKNNDNIKDNDEPTVEEKNNTNEGVVGDKEMNGLKFTNSSLTTYTNNNSTLITTVTNTTEEDVYVRVFNINIKDKDGNLIVSLLGYVGGVIPAGQSRDIESKVDMNLDNAYNIEYEVVND